jgi:uncharacterized protein YigA (DUF484 family)
MLRPGIDFELRDDLPAEPSVGNHAPDRPLARDPEAFAALSFARGVDDDVRSFAASLGAPYCGANAGFAAVQWLDEPAQALSIAMIPLRHESLAGAFGLLVLASPDPTRYTADMGTDFLARIGEVASAALTSTHVSSRPLG